VSSPKHRLDPHRDPIGSEPLQPGVSSEELADHDQAMAWLASEHQVLLAAVHDAAERGFHAHAWRLAWTLVHFLDRRGYWHEVELSSRTR
jgi:hypothetical protein